MSDNIRTYIFKRRIVETLKTEATCEEEAKMIIEEEGAELLNSTVTEITIEAFMDE